MLFWGGTDGICYGYKNKTIKDEDGYDLMSHYGRLIVMSQVIRKDKEGKKIPYATPPGPSELLAHRFCIKTRYTVRLVRTQSMETGWGDSHV